MTLKVKDILESVIYKRNKRCFLCLSGLDPDNFVCISDEISDGDEDTKEVYAMMETVLGTYVIRNVCKEDLICKNCLLLTINAYKFIDACKWNINIMNNLISNITASANEIKEPENGQSAFLLVDPYSNSAEVYVETANIDEVKDTLAKIKDFKENPAKDINLQIKLQKKAEKQDPPSKLTHIDTRAKPKPKGLDLCLTIDCGAIIKSEIQPKNEMEQGIWSDDDAMSYTDTIIYEKEDTTTNKKEDNTTNKKDVTTTYMKEMTFKCILCPKTYSTKKALKQHLEKAHKLKSTRFTCFMCKKSLKNDLQWKNHVLDTHYRMKNDKYACTLCLRSYTKNIDIIKHFRVHNNNLLRMNIKKKITCPKCKKKYQDHAEYKKHFCCPVLSEFVCEQCGKKFNYHISFKKHLETHKNISMTCETCKKQYRDKVSFRKHICKRTKAPKTYKRICDQCGKVCSSNFTLKRHLESHKDNETIMCQLCKKTYRNKEWFKRHICNPNNAPRRHERNYECDYCGNKYRNKNVLRSHIQNMHMSEGTFCPVCNKRMPDKHKLRNHMVVHTKEKNFECTECGAKYCVAAALKTHMRKHTGETPYPCDKCDLKFHSSSVRADHFRRTHCDPIIVVCNLCGTTLKYRGHLKRHLARHCHNKLKKVLL